MSNENVKLALVKLESVFAVVSALVAKHKAMLTFMPGVTGAVKDLEAAIVLLKNA